jgi:hypothetical protein
LKLKKPPAFVRCSRSFGGASFKSSGDQIKGSK